ncbi:unnamed protein product [marine sediment metagenome]|uniref:Uncharacterized protein n=1 Tax=marine sediment metagenome TaxID=412755 RepID=X1B081_9ZZZZ
MQLESLYIPVLTTIKSIVRENEVNDIKTFEFVFNNEEDYKKFDYVAGQFAELSVFGVGECPIGIASSPTSNAPNYIVILRIIVKFMINSLSYSR